MIASEGLCLCGIRLRSKCDCVHATPGYPAPSTVGPIKPPVGLRYDQGKDRYDLLPFDALEEITKVYTKGAEKYAPRNWELGMDWSKCVACLFRHLIARMRGERTDPETGRLHLAHAAWNVITLLSYDLRSVGKDDLKEMYGAKE